MRGRGWIIGLAVVAAIVFFFMRDSASAGMSFGGGFGRAGYTGYSGYGYDSGYKSAFGDKDFGFDLLQEKIDSFNRSIEWDEFENFKTWGPHRSDPCASQSTWTVNCGYHR